MTVRPTLIILAGALAAAVVPAREADAQIPAARAAEQAGRLPEALTDYLNVLDNLPYPPPALQDERLRERIINLVKRMTPAPSLPDEAVTAIERGRTFVRVATGNNDFERAAREFAGAVRAAPWYPGAMLNLAIVQERLQQYNRAVGNLRLFLLAAPGDPQAAAARAKMAELQVLAERAADSIPWQTGHEHDWKIEQRTIEGSTDVWLTAASHGVELKARCVRGTPELYIFWGRHVGDHAVITYRIGSGPQVEEPWNTSTNGLGSFFPADPSPFLADLATAAEFDARVTTSDGGRIHVNFGTSGLDRALPPFRAACPRGDAALAGASQPEIGNPYTDSLLQRVQSLARSQPGELPQLVRYLVFADATAPLGALVAAADTAHVRLSFAVFQIRYRDRWMMVDAGFDRPLLQRLPPLPVAWHQERADSIAPALSGALLVALTSEEFPHAAGVETGTNIAALAPRTLITRTQMQGMLAAPSSFYLRLGGDSVPRYQVVEDAMVRAVAPGVVLIRAPGNSPGAQMVYVHPSAGVDLLLVGDLVWNMAGLERDRQRPEETQRVYGEDPLVIQQQIDWVRRVISSRNVVAIPSHDGSWLDALAARGVIAAGLDLRAAGLDLQPETRP